MAQSDTPAPQHHASLQLRPPDGGWTRRYTPWLRSLGFGSLAAMVVVAPTFVRWCALALLLAFVSAVRPRTPPPPSRGVVRALAWSPWVLLGALALWLLWPLVLGHPPVTRDHAVHYFNTWVWLDEMIPSGRMLGWSTRLNNGLAYGESYPLLGYALTGAAHVVSFGAASLRSSYAWGLLATWTLAIVAVAWLAHDITRDISNDEPRTRWLGRVGGAAAGACWLLDAGASREGGWTYAMFHGVWPQLLATACWSLSLPLTYRAVKQPSWRRCSLAALLLASAALAHPFALPMIAISSVAWMVMVSVHATRAPSRRACAWALAWIHLGAAAVALGWWVRFLASADTMERGPVRWHALSELARELLQARLFDEGLAYTGPFALLGLGLALWRVRGLATVTSIIFIVTLVCASDAAITVLRLDLLASAFKNLQFPRYAIALRPLWAAFAGVGVAWMVGELVERASTATLDAERPAAGFSQRLVRAGLLAPVLLALPTSDGWVRRPVGAIDTLERSSHRDSETALRRALVAERQASPTGALRVAFLRTGMGAATYPMFSIADAGGALVLDGHVPTINVGTQIRRRSPEALAALGVTHVLFDRPLEARDAPLAAAIDVLGKFGPFELARLRTHAPRPAFMLQRSKAGVKAQTSDAASIVLDVVGAQDGERLVAVQAPHPRWQAHQGDHALELRATTAFGGAFMSTTLGPVSDGPLELHYGVQTAERVAAWVSWSAFGLLLVGLLRRRAWIARATASTVNTTDLASPTQPRPNARARRVLRAAWMIVLAGVGIGVFSLQERRLRQTWETFAQRQRPDTRFVRELSQPDDVRLSVEVRAACEPMLGRNPAPACARTLSDDVSPSGSMAYREPYLYRCVAFDVPPGADVELRWLVPDPATSVRGFIVRQSAVGRGRQLAVADPHANPQAMGSFRSLGAQARAFALPTPSSRTGAGSVSAAATSLRFRNDESRPERVCVAAAAFREPASPSPGRGASLDSR